MGFLQGKYQRNYNFNGICKRIQPYKMVYYRRKPCLMIRLFILAENAITFFICYLDASRLTQGVSTRMSTGTVSLARTERLNPISHSPLI